MSYEIIMGPVTETGGCACAECQFAENAAGHAAVTQMQWHAVMHAISTGHRVTEHAETGRVIRPLDGINR